MKDITDTIVFVFYGIVGAVLGLVIFMFGLGGWRFVFTGRATRPWNGAVTLVICLLLGAGWGLVSYKLKEVEFGSRESSAYDNPATVILFMKRLMVIASCLAGAYFIWQLAKGI
jgi:hypothetical protein